MTPYQAIVTKEQFDAAHEEYNRFYHPERTVTIEAVIPWIDTFQRSRGLEGDVIILGIGDGDVFAALGAQIREEERFVVISKVGPGPFKGERGFITKFKTELIVIDEDPVAIIGTEAMELERGNYRIVAVNTLGCMGLAESLLCPGGLVLTNWDSLSEAVLYSAGRVGDTIVLTNDLTWRDDYRKVLSARRGS